MLTVQPYSTSSSIAKRPAFKGEWDKATIDQERDFIERQKEALDSVLNDDYVPDKMKKPFKFFKVLYNAALDGLAVFGAVFFMKDFIKKGANSKVAQKAVSTAKPAIDASAKGLKYVGGKLYDYCAKAYKFLRNTSLGQKSAELYNKFANTEAGKVVIKYTKVAASKAKTLLDKAISPIKGASVDKATNGLATVLGIGSGISGAYETAMKESPVKIEEEIIDCGDDE